MNINTEQVFIVNASELDQHTSTTLQGAFAIPVAGSSLQPEEAQTSMCLSQSLDVPSRTRMCRLCATVTKMVVPIFEGEGLQNNLADKIHQHLPIQVTAEDVLPIVMCYQCTSTLLAWHELVECSIQADSIMKERFSLSIPVDKQQQNNVKSQQMDIKDEKRRGLEPPDDCHLSDDSDDRPLASLRAERAGRAYRAFYDALVRLREHVAAEHAPPDSSSGDSGPAPGACYDDLSGRNRRRSRLAPAAREAVARARRRAGGREVFECGACGRRLGSAHTLLVHLRIHSGERPCVCHVCGAQFRAAPGLRRHLLETHERRRRVPCRTCRRTFANAQNLKQHMRTHTGERPYACEHCGKTFAQSGSLHAHRAVHRAARPHACADCGAAFGLRAGLARHRRRHARAPPAARPHACPLCPAAFRLRRALRHHARRLHPALDPAPDPALDPAPDPPPVYSTTD